MSAFRVEIWPRPGQRDLPGERLEAQLGSLGLTGVGSVATAQLFFLDGALSRADVEALTRALLADEVVESARICPVQEAHVTDTTVEVTFLPGVTDSAAETLLEASALLDVAGLEAAATGRRYDFALGTRLDVLQRVSSALLGNEVIERWSIGAPITPPFAPRQRRDDTLETIALTGVDDAALLRISQTRRLSLDLAEMRAIQSWYKAQSREPNDLELEMLAQTWSEHCVHKTFRAHVDYTELDVHGDPVREERIASLLGTFIRGATEALNKPWVHSAFSDNAGIVAFDDGWDLAIKAETHNRPSALEPFGGANTGVGGVVRDIMGVSARPIANTDVLCFGPGDMPFDALPEGVLHPQRVAEGVIDGIEDYGNKMGIPTVAGAVVYDDAYTANPLVFVGCMGLLPTGSHPTAPQIGDLVVCVGGGTGRDGLRGATFSSMEITHETSQLSGSAVQIGHPIHEKQALEVVLEARDQKLYTAITDCGAGGLSSAIGEMASALGAVVHLERVPLKYPGLKPWEIWLSEAQERMVMAVPPDNFAALEAICENHGTTVTALGEFTGDGRLRLLLKDQCVGDLSVDFLHDGIPRRHLDAVWQHTLTALPELPPGEDLIATLSALLSSDNIRTREPIIRRFDHEVQGGTVVKPLVGPDGHGPGDGVVIAPLATFQRGGRRGAALGIGINPFFGLIDPYKMAWAVIDEAVRNCVAVGADPDRIALLDNFCWGNPKLPDRMGALVQCARGCHDAAIAFGAPFVSGKDSLNNEYTDATGQRRAIPGTLLVHAMGIVPDIGHTTTSALKRAGNALYAVGLTQGELGGSAWLKHHGLSGGRAPEPVAEPMPVLRALHQSIRAGLVVACHDCSEGGLAVAVAEMAAGGQLGARVELGRVPRTDRVTTDATVAFSESNGRFIVEVPKASAADFERQFDGLPSACVGVVTKLREAVLVGLDGTAHALQI